MEGTTASARGASASWPPRRVLVLARPLWFQTAARTAAGEFQLNIQFSIGNDELPSSHDALAELASELRSAMEDAAKALDFEEAARLP